MTYSTAQTEQPPRNPNDRRRLIGKLAAAILLILLLLAGAALGGLLYQRSQEASFLEQSQELTTQEQWREAIDAYSAALAVWPAEVRRHETEARLGRAEARLRSENYAEAVADLDAVLGRNPDLARAYFLRGEARLARQELQGALADFALYAERESAAAEPHLRRAEIYSRQHDFAQALAAADEALERNAQLLEAYLFKSAAHLYLLDFAAARQAATQAVELDPDSALAHALRGRLCCSSMNRMGLRPRWIGRCRSILSWP